MPCLRHNYAHNTNEKRNRAHVASMSYPDYLLPFYLTVTVCDKIKEMSEARDRDYHETITESPLNNRSEPQHVSLSSNANTIPRAFRN